MKTAGVKIRVPVGKAQNFNAEPIYHGLKCTEEDSMDISYAIELDFDPDMFKRIKSAINLIDSGDTELIGGAAELASMEACFLDLSEAIKAYRDAIIRKIARQKNK